MDSPDYTNDTIRARILNGTLPPSGASKVSEATSNKDQLCDGCARPIFALHNRYQIELATASDPQTLSMHRECYLAWLRCSSALPLRQGAENPRP